MSKLKLINLPTKILLKIFKYLQQSNESSTFTLNSTLFLIGLGRTLSKINLKYLYSSLIINLNSLEVEEISKFNSLWGNLNYSNLLENLIITTTNTTSEHHNIESYNHSINSTTTTQFELEETESVKENEITTFLSLLLSKVPNLTSFKWESNVELPPTILCQLLGNNSKLLTSFTLNLNSTSHNTSTSNLRWDANHLSTLPMTLTHLSLSSLSHNGAISLANSLVSLPLLEYLEIKKTVYVDDQLLEAISEGARKLKRLKISEMSGTKLTEKGLICLLEGVDLECLELDSVEGRLSKNCWKSLLPLPDSLSTIRITYSESGPYKSWSLDHLHSLHYLLSSPTLTSFTIARKPPLESLIPGQHHLSTWPIFEGLQPKPIPNELYDQLILKNDEGGKWKELGLNLYSIKLDQLKKIVDNSPELVKLSILLDAPFKSLLTLNTSFGLTHHLQELRISVDPSHTPELSSCHQSNIGTRIHHQSQLFSTSTTTTSSHHISTSPITPISSPTSTRSILLSSSTKSNHSNQSPSSPPLSIYSRSPTSPTLPSTSSTVTTSSIPTTREWRRFLKKTLNLKFIEWGGRGGFGTWYFNSFGKEKENLTGSNSNSSTSSNSHHSTGIKEVEFEPIIPSNTGIMEEEIIGGVGVGGEGRRRSSVSSIGSYTTSIQSGNGGNGSRNNIRRMSEISNKGINLDGLGLSSSSSNELVPTSPSVLSTKSIDEKKNSIDNNPTSTSTTSINFNPPSISPPPSSSTIFNPFSSSPPPPSSYPTTKITSINPFSPPFIPSPPSFVSVAAKNIPPLNSNSFNNNNYTGEGTTSMKAGAGGEGEKFISKSPRMAKLHLGTTTSTSTIENGDFPPLISPTLMNENNLGMRRKNSGSGIGSGSNENEEKKKVVGMIGRSGGRGGGGVGGGKK